MKMNRRKGVLTVVAMTLAVGAVWIGCHGGVSYVANQLADPIEVWAVGTDESLRDMTADSNGNPGDTSAASEGSLGALAADNNGGSDTSRVEAVAAEYENVSGTASDNAPGADLGTASDTASGSTLPTDPMDTGKGSASQAVTASDAEPSGKRVYVYARMIRIDENGQTYVYVRGEDTRLHRQDVTVGRLFSSLDMDSCSYGIVAEISSGLESGSYVAFPYGSNVCEGARTTISEDYEWAL